MIRQTREAPVLGEHLQILSLEGFKRHRFVCFFLIILNFGPFVSLEVLLRSGSGANCALGKG